MRAPLSWLCDYAPFDQSIDELSDALSSLGLVVEGIERVGEPLDGVVVARILAIRTHPDAERIRLVDVDAGDGESLQIACGAWNMGVGDLVPLARIGAVLPGGMEIARRKMRGQWSNGMLCSPGEVGLAEPGGPGGLMILPAGTAAAGTPIGEALGGADVVFDLEVPPNRPDASCMAGVSRDLAAKLGIAWSWPSGPPGQVAPGVVGGSSIRPSVEVEEPTGCGRFVAAVLGGIRVGESPAWLTTRLTRAGMRPINAVVDVSNYVMLDLGAPNHAYDRARLGGGGLLVRRARAGESLVTLDTQNRELAGEDLVICDATGSLVGIAGIMGGARAEISETTTEVVVEAAWFAPGRVSRTGARLGLGSEARQRFERGVDPEACPRAVDRFVELLAAALPGSPLTVGPSMDFRSEENLPTPALVTLRTSRVNALLGAALDDASLEALLNPIGFAVVVTGPGTAQVGVPTWRPDSTREVDVIEEIARHHGYPNIPRTVPGGSRSGGLSAYQRERRRVREVLAGTGCDEVWTSTFLGPGDLEAAGQDPVAVVVANPLDRSESLLRSGLLPGMAAAARFNAARQRPDVAFFEIGRIFSPGPEGNPLPVETEQLGVLVAGENADAPLVARIWGVLSDALGLSGVTLVGGEVPGLHPTRSARILGDDGATIGSLGELDPDVIPAVGLTGRVGFLTVALEQLLAQPRRSRRARPVSRYPASDVDLAFVVPEAVAAASVASTLTAAAGSHLESLELFDVFRDKRLGSDRRSLAFRLRLRASDRTLEVPELAERRRSLIDAVMAAHGAELRV